MKIAPLLILFSFFLTTPGPRCHAQSGRLAQLTAGESKDIAKFSSRLQSELKKDDVHGSLSALILKNDKVIWTGVFGYLNRNNDMPADTGTIYHIGSITKTVTAALLMQLTEEGKVKLDDPVEKYVPEARSLKGYGTAPLITLRQLASHTSGLAREPALDGAQIGPAQAWENKLLSCIPYTSFDHRPGSKWEYSNIGYALLGLALERASGVPYIEMVQERILTPLHMDNSFFSIPENKIAQLAEGIPNANEPAMSKIDTSVSLQQFLEVGNIGYMLPAGGLCSTPLDLAKFLIALEGNKLLKPASLHEMQTIPPGGRNYGLGFTVSRDGRGDLVGHGGRVPGYKTAFLIEQHSGYAVILMRNYNLSATNLELTSRNLLIKLLKDSR